MLALLLWRDYSTSIFHIFSVWAIKVRRFSYKPSHKEIMHFFNKPSYKTLFRISIEGMTNAFYRKAGTNNWKATWILISLICFLARIILLLSYAGVYTYDYSITNTSNENHTKVVTQLDNITFKQLISGSNIRFNPLDTLYR